MINYCVTRCKGLYEKSLTLNTRFLLFIILFYYQIVCMFEFKNGKVLRFRTKLAVHSGQYSSVHGSSEPTLKEQASHYKGIKSLTSYGTDALTWACVMDKNETRENLNNGNVHHINDLITSQLLDVFNCPQPHGCCYPVTTKSSRRKKREQLKSISNNWSDKFEKVTELRFLR